MNTLIMMAGGTGGHIYPGLAVAKILREKGINVIWMGVRDGLEDKVAQQEGFLIDYIRIQGLWNSGILRRLSFPIWMMYAIFQCFAIILRRRPDALVGMGGYVCAPGGIAAFLLRRPFLIHESNAVAGLANQILAYFASQVLTGFPGVKIKGNAVCVGTPVRREIVQAGKGRIKARHEDTQRKLRLLVLGGSQGARTLNERLPEVIDSIPEKLRPKVVHQTGRGRAKEVEERYGRYAIEAVEIHEFIDDMASIYASADIVIARAGAMTVAEVSVMGLAAIFVPYPHAARNHQYLNAKKLKGNGGALICLEEDHFVATLTDHLQNLLSQRSVVEKMSKRIRKFSRVDAAELVADHCLKLMGAQGVPSR